jgi:hypothetical protein
VTRQEEPVYDVAVLALEEGCAVRAPVLALRDELAAAGARVDVVTAGSDAEIDEVLARLDAPPRPDGLLRPHPDGKARLVVAAAADGQLRAVVRRLLRRYAVPPRSRPADLAAHRTLPDLPPLAVLALDPELATRLDLPRDPAGVAAAVLGDPVRRLDLLRTDSGSVTLDGSLLGAADESGRALPWYAQVEVDDAVLTAGGDPLLAVVVANGSRYGVLDGLPLVPDADPADGALDVGLVIPVVTRSLWRRHRRVEVRRARGRAVSVTPRGGVVPLLDDGVPGELDRRRSWWVEPGAWGVYAG